MMAAAGQWIVGIVAVSVVLYLTQCLVPDGALRRVADLTGGLILIVTILQPLTAISPRDLTKDLRRLEREMELQQTVWSQAQQTELAQVIAQRTAEYILDRGAALGMNLSVQVETDAGEDGIPIPYAAMVTGPYTDALSQMMEEELGIPPERQVWYEREN